MPFHSLSQDEAIEATFTVVLRYGRFFCYTGKLLYGR